MAIIEPYSFLHFDWGHLEPHQVDRSLHPSQVAEGDGQNQERQGLDFLFADHHQRAFPLRQAHSPRWHLSEKNRDEIKVQHP